LLLVFFILYNIIYLFKCLFKYLFNFYIYLFIYIYIFIYFYIYIYLNNLKLVLNTDSSYSEKQFNKDISNNEKLISLCDKNNFNFTSNSQLNFKFLFPQNFDQENFLYNFKNNEFFEDYASVEDNTVLVNFNKSSEEHNKIENNSSNFTIDIVNNLNEIKETSKKNDVFFCGIAFETPTKYSIYLHYNETEIINYIYLYSYESTTFTDSIIKDFKEFYMIQAITDNAVYKTLTNSTNSKNIHIFTKTMDMDMDGITKTLEKQLLFNNVIILASFFFIPCILALFNHLVIEKESRIKESLLIIGLNNSSFWLSWAIIYGFIILFNSIIITAIMYHFKFISFIHWSVIVIVMVIYGLSCCCLSFILSTFLKKSRITMIINTFIIFIFYMISDIILIIYEYFKETIPSVVIINYLFSPSAFIFLFRRIMDFENTGQTITLLSIFKIKSLFNSFMCLVFTFMFYFFIAIYLDNVLPQGNNIHRKWHFFITDVFKNKNKKLETNYSNINLNNPFIQPDPKNPRLAAVEVKHIKKKFKVKEETINVLNDISFNAY